MFVAEPPRITTHPQQLRNAIPGKPTSFTIQATGTEPLSYSWQWKPAEESKEWQPCNALGSNTATLTIPSVQKSNEGSYCCIISNYAGSQTSNAADLSVGKNSTFDVWSMKLHHFHIILCAFWTCFYVAEPPEITIHPQEVRDAVRGKSAKFAIQATGADPLSYHWQWKPAEEASVEGSEEWQPCDAEWTGGVTLTIPGVQKSNEGSYRCVISNNTTQTSNPAALKVS